MPSDWILVSKTTKEEVIELYGEPDWTRVSPDGELAAYWPRATHHPPWPIRVPVAEPAGNGMITTKEQAIEPGLGVKSWRDGTQKRPDKMFRIHYDANQVVKTLIE
jgi:hypothetical protein